MTGSARMVTKIIRCYCGSENIVRHGPTKNGKHRYLCRDCKRSNRQDSQPNGDTAEQCEEVLRACKERGSLRGLTRTFGVARNTVSGWLRKGGEAPAPRARRCLIPTTRSQPLLSWMSCGHSSSGASTNAGSSSLQLLACLTRLSHYP